MGGLCRPRPATIAGSALSDWLGLITHFSTCLRKHTQLPGHEHYSTTVPSRYQSLRLPKVLLPACPQCCFPMRSNQPMEDSSMVAFDHLPSSGKTLQSRNVSSPFRYPAHPGRTATAANDRRHAGGRSCFVTRLAAVPRQAISTHLKLPLARPKRGLQCLPASRGPGPS